MLAAWAPVPPGCPASSHLSWAGRSLCWLSLLLHTCLGCVGWAPQGQSPSSPILQASSRCLNLAAFTQAACSSSSSHCWFTTFWHHLPAPLACALLSLPFALRVCPTTQRPSSHSPWLLKFLGMPRTPQGSQDAHFWPVQVLALKPRTV